MGISKDFFMLDDRDNVRLNINTELFNIMTTKNKDSYEMMLVLITELFSEIGDLTELIMKESPNFTEKGYEDMEYLLFCRDNYKKYLDNQEKILKRIQEIEGMDVI